jgi:hypothetical protein
MLQREMLEMGTYQRGYVVCELRHSLRTPSSSAHGIADLIADLLADSASLAQADIDLIQSAEAAALNITLDTHPASRARRDV